MVLRFLFLLYTVYMETSQIIVGLNIFFVLSVIFFIQRLLKASSTYNWHPGDNDIQLAQRIIILKCIVGIACIGIIAAAINIALG